MRNARHLIKLVVAAALILLLLWRLDLRRLADTWTTLNWTYVGLSLMITPVMVTVAVARWSVLLSAQQMPCRFGRLWIVYLAGVLLNQILPTSIGGDVLKAYQIGRDHQSVSRSAAAVFVDRFLGLAAVMLFGCIVFALYLRHLHEPLLNLGFALVLAGFSLLVAVVFWPRSVRWGQRVLFRGRGERLFAVAERWHQDILAFRRKRAAAAHCFILAVVFHLLAVVHVFWVLRVFTGAGSFADVFVMVPGIFLVSVIPISVGGVGVNEWAYLFFLNLAGIAPETGFSVALFVRLKTVLFGASGFVAFLAARHTWSTAPPERSRAGQAVAGILGPSDHCEGTAE